MEKNFFDNAQKLVHEHDELTQLLNNLENINTSIGIIYNNELDSGGINYKKYSNDVKDFLKKCVNDRLIEIEKQFN